MVSLKGMLNTALLAGSLLTGGDAVAQQLHAPHKSSIDASVKMDALATLKATPGFSAACDKLNALSRFDAKLGMKVVYGNAPSDKLLLAAAEYLQISFVAEHKLIVRSQQDAGDLKDDLCHKVGGDIQIKKIGGGDVFNGRVVTVPRYEIDLGTLDAITVKAKLQESGNSQFMVEYADRQTCNLGIYHFPDPEFDNGLAGQYRLSDSSWNAALINPGASSKDVDSSLEARRIATGILLSKGLPPADVEVVVFDGGALPNDINITKQFNFVTGTPVVTSDPHGEAVTHDGFAITNLNGGAGTAPGANINISQIGGGGIVYINKLYDAQDSLYLRMLQYPDRVFVSNWSFMLGNDAIAHSGLTATYSLTKPGGGMRAVCFKGSGNSGPLTIDACGMRSEPIMCGGWTADLPNAPTASLVSTGPGMSFSGGPAENMRSWNGTTFVFQQGTSFATPTAAGDGVLVIEEAGGDISFDKFMKRLRGGAIDTDAPGYDVSSGYGALTGWGSISYAPGENWPRGDMVDSSGYAISGAGYPIIPYKPLYLNGDTAIIGGQPVQLLRECLYPDNTLVPYITVGSERIYQPEISPAHGFSDVNPSVNFLRYQIKQDVAGAPWVVCPTKPFPITGFPTPLPTPIVAQVDPVECESNGIQTGKLLNPPTGAAVSITLNGSPVSYNADSTFQYNLNTLGANNLHFEYNNGIISDTDVAFFVNQALTPNVTTNATPISLCTGQSQTFTVNTTNCGSPTYQWQARNGASWVNIAGATGQSYTKNFAAPVNPYKVRAIVQPSAGCYVAAALNLLGQPDTIQVQFADIDVQQSANPLGNAYPNTQSLCLGVPAVCSDSLGATNGVVYTKEKIVDGINQGAFVGNTTLSGLTPGNHTYAVKYTRVGANNCAPQTIYSDTINVVVSNALTPTAGNVTANPAVATACLGAAGPQFTATATGVGPVPTYVWKKGGVTIPGATSASWTPNAAFMATARSGNITCEITRDPNGCYTGGSPVTVTSGPYPFAVTTPASISITAAPNDSNCTNIPVALTGVASGGSPVYWSGGVNNGVYFVPPASGVYTATTTDANGCVSTATQVLTVLTAPNVTLTSNPFPAEVCIGDLLTLNANGAANYAWTGVVGSGASVSFVPTVNGIVSVIGTAPNGCADTAQINYVIKPQYTAAGNATFDGDTNSVQNVCDLATHQLNYTETAPIAPGSTIALYRNGNLVAGSVQPIYQNTPVSFAETTQVNSQCVLTVFVMPPAGACQDTLSDTITVYNNLVDVTITPSGPNLSVPLTAGTTYQWQILDGTWKTPTAAQATNANTNAMTALTNGQRRVVATKNGCQSTSNTETVTGVGINDVQLPGVRIYPNPATNVVYIDGLSPEGTYDIKTIDVTGRVISMNSAWKGSSGDKVGINVEAYATGVYTVFIRDRKTGASRKEMITVSK